MRDGICTRLFSSCSAIETRLRGTREHSRIQLLVECILPGLEDLDPQLTPEAMLAEAVEANVRWTMRQILETPEGRERKVEGQVKLVGAIYEIETGLVRFLE
jgi:carbonic anhydrase